MIFRRLAHGGRTKLNIHFLKLYSIWKPWTTAVVKGCTVVEFLCPKIRGMDWHVFNSREENIDRWLRHHAKGSYCIHVTVGRLDKTNQFFHSETTVSFQNSNDALMFKLQMG